MFFKTLPASAQRLFSQLGKESEVKPFYLAGGSAAALHMGHRISVDLDFFTPDDLKSPALLTRLQKIGALKIQQQSAGTFVGLLTRTQISFFYYAYPLLETPSEFQGVRIASLLDIALMKITAISQRGRRRDFVDLYFICQNGYTLASLLEQIPKKFTTLTYPSYHLLRALVYFDDAEHDPRLKMLVPYNWREIKHFFETQVRDLMRRF
jgi:hypothetical protein